MAPHHKKQDATFFLSLAHKILLGKPPSKDEYHHIAAVSDGEIFSLFPGADQLRNAFYQKGIHLCTICNAKSGNCSEDCAFCSQSRVSKASITTYPLLSREELQQAGRAAAQTPIHRYSLVTSGKRIS